MYRLLQVFGAIMLLITTVQCLSCPYERLLYCTAKETLEEECPYGVTKDLCNQCWTCAKGYKEECGGIWNAGGRCAEGFRCSNPHDERFTYAYQKEGICCRNTPLIQRPLALPVCKTGVVVNPCSKQYECKRAQGEVCGGDGDIFGVCEENLVCYPPLSYSTSEVNSTCIYQDELPSTTKDYSSQ